MKRYLFLLLFPFCVAAQDAPFENEIRAFEKADSATPPPRNPILFTGSSSIRFWSSLATDFPGKPVLNRGFGGSQLSDVMRYADRIIIPYHPKQIVIYAGENDIAAGQTGQQTFDRFVALFEYIRQKLPKVPVAFIAIKPSPSRRKYFAENDTANRLIKDYLAKQKKARFVDIRPVMLQPNGQPVPDLFRQDSLHMLPAGYERWTKVVKPYLK
ncbi:GDSL-type esterase/lipase family protein [Spirosoma spitsbergense]|uniref:GDSL-type esterase/lipase family protein n=1 Tax=Spirosoma spitsbergense TaxID=431554 RepID=UPI0003731020|nr:GDSL-type esterase/lipase family protein [Spirosoma spitsbergense]